jgi:hypothetical protein
VKIWSWLDLIAKLAGKFQDQGFEVVIVGKLPIFAGADES